MEIFNIASDKFVLVSGDGFARMYGQGERGIGHALMIENDFWGDPLAVGGKITRVCGGTLECGKAVEKFLGDKRCPKCVEWLATDVGAAHIDRARGMYAMWADGGETVRQFLADVLPLDGTETGGEDSAPEAREITPAEVTEIVKASTGANKRRKRSAAIERERERLTAQREAREAGAEIIASTGKTLAQMREETAAHYANGAKPSPEIESLPAPGTVNFGSGTVSGSALPVLPCEFRGGVEVINLERTHGKCPACTTYIPLLPDTGTVEAAPKVSKIKCDGTGSAPAPGTRVQRDDHKVSVADDYSGKTSAPCGTCTRVIAVSRDGVMRRHNGLEAREAGAAGVDRIGTHNVGGVATPATKGLSSRMIDTVEHGSVPGDTATADKRRTDESRCKRGNKILKDATGGKVECPECARLVELLKITRPNGDVSWKIPHHVRPGESVKHVGRGEVRDVTPRGDGADVGATVRKDMGTGARLALSRGHGTVDGAATTGSQNMAPVQPKGWIGTAGTGQLPATVRPGIDPEVSGDICPLPECKGQRKDVAHKGRSAGWRRRHSSKIGAVLRERKARRDAERAAAIERGEIASTAERKAGRKAASVGSFAEGNVNGAVSHESRPEFAPKGERRPAVRKADKVTRETARTALRSVRAGK